MLLAFWWRLAHHHHLLNPFTPNAPQYILVRPRISSEDEDHQREREYWRYFFTASKFISWLVQADPACCATAKEAALTEERTELARRLLMQAALLRLRRWDSH